VCARAAGERANPTTEEISMSEEDSSNRPSAPKSRGIGGAVVVVVVVLALVLLMAFNMN
jgi:hypothetical protein